MFVRVFNINYSGSEVKVRTNYHGPAVTTVNRRTDTTDLIRFGKYRTEPNSHTVSTLLT